MNNFKHKDTETVGNVHIVLKLKKDDVVVWLSDKVDLKCVTHVATLGWASCHPLSKGLHSAASNVSTIKNNRTVFFNKESTLLSMTKKNQNQIFPKSEVSLAAFTHVTFHDFAAALVQNTQHELLAPCMLSYSTHMWTLWRPENNLGCRPQKCHPPPCNEVSI